MKKKISHIGLVLIYIGVFVLLLSFVFEWTKYYTVLFLPLILIISGLILYVFMLKRESRY